MTQTFAAQWQEIAAKITGYQKPNSALARKQLDMLDSDYEDQLSEVFDALQEYEDCTREDFDSAEEYRDARSEAWDSFIGAIEDFEPEESDDEDSDDEDSDETALEAEEPDPTPKRIPSLPKLPPAPALTPEQAAKLESATEFTAKALDRTSQIEDDAAVQKELGKKEADMAKTTTPERKAGKAVSSFDQKVWMINVAEKFLSPKLASQMVESMLDRTLDLTVGQVLPKASSKAAEKTERKGKVWTDEERAAAGLRMITARAAKLGLSVTELKTLKLRPGTAPTDEQMKVILKARKAAAPAADKKEEAPAAEKVVEVGGSSGRNRRPTLRAK